LRKEGTGQGTHNDATLNPKILLLEQPDLDARFLQGIHKPNQLKFSEHPNTNTVGNKRENFQSTYTLEEPEDEVLPRTRDPPATTAKRKQNHKERQDTRRASRSRG
jgi:hypothetical protein